MNISPVSIFTVEEENLICVFDTGSRAALIADLRGVLPDFDEQELREIAEIALRKLETMSDTDFSGLVLEPAYVSDDREE
jgi:hypothetical protein